MKETFVFVALMAVVIILTVKCTPAASRALDVAGYTAELARCRAEGKDAGSYAVYGRCAAEADKKYGVEP